MTSVRLTHLDKFCVASNFVSHLPPMTTSIHLSIHLLSLKSGIQPDHPRFIALIPMPPSSFSRADHKNRHSFIYTIHNRVAQTWQFHAQFRLYIQGICSVRRNPWLVLARANLRSDRSAFSNTEEKHVTQVHIKGFRYCTTGATPLCAMANCMRSKD